LGPNVFFQTIFGFIAIIFSILLSLVAYFQLEAAEDERVKAEEALKAAAVATVNASSALTKAEDAAKNSAQSKRQAEEALLQALLAAELSADSSVLAKEAADKATKNSEKSLTLQHLSENALSQAKLSMSQAKDSLDSAHRVKAEMSALATKTSNLNIEIVRQNSTNADNFLWEMRSLQNKILESVTQLEDNVICLSSLSNFRRWSDYNQVFSSLWDRKYGDVCINYINNIMTFLFRQGELISMIHALPVFDEKFHERVVANASFELCYSYSLLRAISPLMHNALEQEGAFNYAISDEVLYGHLISEYCNYSRESENEAMLRWVYRIATILRTIKLETADKEIDRNYIGRIEGKLLLGKMMSEKEIREIFEEINDRGVNLLSTAIVNFYEYNYPHSFNQELGCQRQILIDIIGAEIEKAASVIKSMHKCIGVKEITTDEELILIYPSNSMPVFESKLKRIVRL
jgi:hypothetical protein